MTTGEVLRQALNAQLAPGAAAWLADACTGARRSPIHLLRYYTEASRRLGRHPLTIPALPDALAGFPFAHWTFEDAGRLLLLLEHREASSAAFQQAAAACFEQGDA